jgi:hypothetical protein
MPLINVKTSAAAPADPEALLLELSRTLAALLGKPERYGTVKSIGASPPSAPPWMPGISRPGCGTGTVTPPAEGAGAGDRSVCGLEEAAVPQSSTHTLT